MRKYLFVASTGGHLAELLRLSGEFEASPDSLWLTFDTEQSRSLLSGRRVAFLPYVHPRDYRAVLRTAVLSRDVFKNEHFDVAVSTGAAVVLGVFPLARLSGVQCVYIESASRLEGPSLTGKILDALRLAKLYTQYAEWANKRWEFRPSVLAGFRPIDKEQAPTNPLRIFVTLGTIKPYRFDAVVDAVLRTGLAGTTTTWQVGATTRSDLPGRVFAETSASEFESLARDADVVISHAGVGTLLNLLELGVYPVVVPRRRSRHEHVDDHQTQIGRLVSRLGIGRVSEADDLQATDLHNAALLANASTHLESHHDGA